MYKGWRVRVTSVDARKRTLEDDTDAGQETSLSLRNLMPAFSCPSRVQEHSYVGGPFVRLVTMACRLHALRFLSLRFLMYVYTCF